MEAHKDVYMSLKFYVDLEECVNTIHYCVCLNFVDYVLNEE